MKSPITGSEMTIQKEWRKMIYRNEEFDVYFHTWMCEDTGEQFENDELADLNYNQVVNQYREKHNIPFPFEIRAIREKYNLPAIKMSQILGLGDNTYRQYESGEMPTQANARLIQLAENPDEFLKLVSLSEFSDLKKIKEITNTAENIYKVSEENKLTNSVVEYLFGSKKPNKYTGFKKSDFNVFAEMILFFSQMHQPWKTKLNKMLFYSDFTFFKKYGYSISGAEYYAINMGPVPNNFNSIFELLDKQNIINIQYSAFSNGGVGEKFFPGKRNFDKTLFSDDELQTLNQISKKFKNISTNKIIEMSHEEKAWIENKSNNNSPIEYFYAFDLKY